MHISAGVGEFRSVTIGAESFSEEIIERIDAAGLLDKNQWVDVEFVAVHPDNREKAMVVPVDAHQLLKAISDNGWSWEKWNGLLPPTTIGKEWCNKHQMACCPHLIQIR